MNMKITKEKLTKARATAERLQLEGRDLLYKPLDYINSHCNGIGPEKWPSAIRAAVSKLHKSAEIAAMIHDLWWDESAEDIDDEELLLCDFRVSNSAFQRNALKLADYYYGWFNPLRYLARHEGRKFRKLLDAFGWPNFLKAVGKSEK